MIEPGNISAVNPRSLDAVAAAAHAVQANVAALRVAWCKRTGEPPDSHDIKTPTPGAVRHSREILIDWQTLRDYAFEEIVLRLRQVWGEFSALCWLFPNVDPQHPIRFDPLEPGQSIRCPMHIFDKLNEVQAGLWRIRHEQRARHDPKARKDPAFQREHEIALTRDVKVFGQHVSLATDDDLFCCACEYAGMLAALRWTSDDRWSWEAPGIMDVTLHNQS